MNILKKYSIAYKGLGIGSHHFEFDVDDRFFEAFDGSEIRRGHASVAIDLEKQSRLMTLAFKIEGEVEVTCDRCLEEFFQPVLFDGTLQVRFSETEKESDGEILWISPNESELELAQYIYESINLGLPYRRVHPTDAAGRSLCNPDMLSRFRIISEEEFEQFAAGAGSDEKAENDNEGPWAKLEEVKKVLSKK